MGVVDPLLEDALQSVGEELAALTKSKSFAGVKNAARRSGQGGGFDLGDESEGGGQSGFLGGRSDSEADGLDNLAANPFFSVARSKVTKGIKLLRSGLPYSCPLTPQNFGGPRFPRPISFFLSPLDHNDARRIERDDSLHTPPIHSSRLEPKSPLFRILNLSFRTRSASRESRLPSERCLSAGASEVFRVSLRYFPLLRAAALGFALATMTTISGCDGSGGKPATGESAVDKTKENEENLRKAMMANPDYQTPDPKKKANASAS